MQKTITRSDRIEFLSKVLHENVTKSNDLGILVIDDNELFFNVAFKFVHEIDLTFPIDINEYDIHLKSRIDLVIFMYTALFDVTLDKIILRYINSKPNNIILDDALISKLEIVMQIPLDKSSIMPLLPLGIKVHKGEIIPNPAYNMIMRKAQDLLIIESKRVITQISAMLKRNTTFNTLKEEFICRELQDDNKLL